MAQVDVKVRFNKETDQIEVVFGDQVVGGVEKEVWESWLPVAPVDTASSEVVEQVEPPAEEVVVETVETE